MGASKKVIRLAGERSGFDALLIGLAHRYCAVATDLLGDRLVTMVLFGSVARREATATSDIDLLVIVDQAPRRVMVRRAILEPVRERVTPDLEELWQQDIFVDFSEFILTREEAAQTHRLYLDILEDGIILRDCDGFFAAVLAGLRAKLERLGAQRKRIGSFRYWDLKPDFKPGDVIEL